MFSQACVKNSVHRGWGVSEHALGQTPRWQTAPLPWADTPPRTDTLPQKDTLPLEDTPLGRHLPPPAATAAGGTHHTGMHSYSLDHSLLEFYFTINLTFREFEVHLIRLENPTELK